MDKIQESKNRYLRKRRILRKRTYKRHLENKECLFCGSKTRLEYHHINPDKKFMNVGTLILCGYSNSTILKEIKKCILVCCKCHNTLHLRVKGKTSILSDLGKSILRFYLESGSKKLLKEYIRGACQ